MFKRNGAGISLGILMGKIQIVDLAVDGAGNVERACSILSNGGVVALPTETVYGLAASIDHSQGLQTIFSLKKRPHADPLIVHVFDASWISRFAKLTLWQSSVANALAARFWPGPLTMVLESKSSVDPLVRAGSSTVALRSPRHPFFRAVLRALDSGIAAPSANMFGHISPTSARDVAQEFSDSDLVIFDGGDCDIGIESTVVRIDDEGRLRILRPGIVTENEIQKCLGAAGLVAAIHSEALVTQKNSTPQMSPGTLLKHYSPRLPTYILTDGEFAQDWHQSSSQAIPSHCCVILDFGSSLLRFVESGEIECLSYLNPAPDGDLENFTQKLFATLRLAESIQGCRAILIHFPCAPEQGWSQAIHDRIYRAAAGKRAIVSVARRSVQVFDAVL